LNSLTNKSNTMKNKILIIIALFVTAYMISCQSPQTKEINAQETLDKAKSDIEKATQDSAIKAQKDSAQVFFDMKKDWEKLINANDKTIAELKADAAKNKSKGSPKHLQRLSDLEQRNNELTSRIRNYNYSDSSWVQFKMNVKSDMKDLEKDIKNSN